MPTSPWRCTAATTPNGEVTASIARRGETNANSMMADAKLAAAKAFFVGSEYEGLPIVALLCGGSCRSSIAAGDVSYADVMSLFLSGGMGSSGLYVKTTGAVLWEAIEWGLSSLTGQDPETGEIFANGSYHGRFPTWRAYPMCMTSAMSPPRRLITPAANTRWARASSASRWTMARRSPGLRPGADLLHLLL